MFDTFLLHCCNPFFSGQPVFDDSLKSPATSMPIAASAWARSSRICTTSACKACSLCRAASHNPHEGTIDRATELPYRALFNTLLIKYVILYIHVCIWYVKHAILYHAYSILASSYQIVTFLKHQPSSLGWSFWEMWPFFELAISPCFHQNPYIRMCVLTIGSLKLVGKNTNSNKYKVKP